jgi:EmrB/QacA subfamily drug resistance transporter
MSKQQKRVLIISILASFVAFLDGSVVNVALPAMVRELGGGLSAQQWIIDAYLITLGALILVAGSLSDIFGRRRILSLGLIGFGTASVLCAVAPSAGFLIASRGLQGVAGALLVPSSLALIISSFEGKAQSKAIGSWTAWTGIAIIIGPLLGGFLVDAVSWRLVFAINILPIVVTLWLLKSLVMNDQPVERVSVDLLGAVLCTVGLGGPVYALIEQAHYGWFSLNIVIAGVLGVSSLVGFIWHEKRTAQPMLPLGLFRARNFTVGNVATLAIYGALSVATFIISVYIQQGGGLTATAAGLSLLPITLIMFVLSSRFGALAGEHGPRFFMAAGPIVAAIGFLVMLRVDATFNYWTDLLPGVLIFGLGLSMTVAPLTAAVLSSVSARQAGIGSAVNNAISRIAGLLAIAGLGTIIGPTLNLQGFHRGLIATACLMMVGGIVSAFGIQNAARALPDQSKT